MALEGQDVVAWMYDILKADAGAEGFATLVGGRVFRDQVPQTALLPAALVSLVSHVDVNTMGGRRSFARTLADVHIIDNGVNYGAANAAGRRADFLLQGTAGLKSGTYAVKLRRDSVQAFVESEAGKSYSHVVMTYRTEAHV